MSVVDILIPTFNNTQYLMPCVRSILEMPQAKGLFRVVIVNNGEPESIAQIESLNDPRIAVVQAGGNRGWEGGLKLGLEQSKSPYVMFMNDDTFVPISNGYWLNTLLSNFVDKDVAAVGPSSNVVAGIQNIFAGGVHQIYEASYLIGFCCLLRRDRLDEVGGVDDALPYHGDDLDLSMRLRRGGYKLVTDKRVFVYHHGFKTGTREMGSYWNSVLMQEKTSHSLIRKHGLKEWWKTVTNQLISKRQREVVPTGTDQEAEVVKRFVVGKKVLDLGCGHKKVVKHAVGVDLIPQGELIPSIGEKSVADVQGNIEDPLPFDKASWDTIIARHIVEHCVDFVNVIQNWRSLLRAGGRLIIAVPDHSRFNSIPMNIEHVHGFTKQSFQSIMRFLGFKHVDTVDSGNNISFVTVWEKE